MSVRNLLSSSRLMAGALLFVTILSIPFVVASYSIPTTVFTAEYYDDTPDAMPGDGVCETAAGNGECTLRAAVEESNELPGDDVIHLRAGTYTLSRAGAGEDDANTGDLDITSNIQLIGTGKGSTTIAGDGGDRIIHILADNAGEDLNVTIADLTITQGNVMGAGNLGDGGGIFVDDGATLMIARSSIEANNAANWGGGIFIDGSSAVTLDTVYVENNQAQILAGGIDNYRGTLTISDSFIINNQVLAGPGGGIFNDGDATTIIMSSLIGDNHASLDGGGIYNYGGSFGSGGSLQITQSSILGNHADVNGGGLYNLGVVTLIENSTFGENDADGDGGAIFNQDVITAIEYTTLYDNSAGSEGGGIYNKVSSPLHVANSIVANNSQINCVLEDDTDVTSAGFNIEDGNSCTLVGAINTDPQLEPLADVGCSRMGYLPSEGSPAIDSAVDATPPDFDQCNVARPQGNGVDIGALERPMADVSITKSDDPDAVLAGELLTYTLTVANAGQSVAQDLVVTDVLTDVVTFVSAEIPPPHTCNNAGPIVTCDINQLASGADVEISIVVQAPVEGGVITNTASVTASTSDHDASNNTATESTTVTPVSDLWLDKADTADPVDAGTPFAYTLIAVNAGPSTATGVTISDTLSAGVGYVSASGVGWDCSYVAPTVTCVHSDPLPVGAAQPITLDVVAPAMGGPLYNVAQVSGDNVDFDLGNNTDGEWTEIFASADLAVVKTDAVDPVYAGMPLTYTIQVDNYGPSVAANVVVSDSLPADAVFVSASATGWVCDYDSDTHEVVCTIAVLETGGPSDLIEVVVLASAEAGTLTNSATITSGALDPDPTNNSDDEDTSVLAVADLEITQTHAPEPVYAAQTLSYMLHVENAGPSTATAILVTSQLPTDVTILAVDGSGWICSFNNTLYRVTCTRDTLAVGSAPTITIDVQAPDEGGTTVNEAEVSSPITDFDLTDNLATEDATVIAVADMEITISDNPDPVNTDSLLVYTVDVRNHGPSTAHNIVFTQTLPTEVTFVGATGDDWDCEHDSNFNKVTCDFALLPADMASEVEVVVRTPEQGTVIDTTAEVSADEVDLESDNNSDSEQTYVNPADMLIEIYEAPGGLPGVGHRVEYILRVHNIGPGDALDAQATVWLPDSVTFNDCSGVPCSFSNGIITYELGDMLSGATEFISFEYTPLVEGYYTATAWVQSPVIVDLFPHNNSIEIVLNTYRQLMPIVFGSNE